MPWMLVLQSQLDIGPKVCEATWCLVVAITSSALKESDVEAEKIHGKTTGKSMENPLPSGYVKIAIENGHRNSEFSHEKW